jgi:hypothetical protein
VSVLVRSWRTRGCCAIEGGRGGGGPDVTHNHWATKHKNVWTEYLLEEPKLQCSAKEESAMNWVLCYVMMTNGCAFYYAHQHKR